MASNKSRGDRGRGALEPQRRPGKERVASLIDAAAAVIAERGFDAATMTEIAARAGALVGSVYHFLPNKEALADALIQRFIGVIEDAFAAIDAQAVSMPSDALADALVDFMVRLRGESKALIALMDARREWSATRQNVLDAIQGHIARTLRLRTPQLAEETAQGMAIVLMHTMKAMKALAGDPRKPGNDAAASELRIMTRLYLAGKLT